MKTYVYKLFNNKEALLYVGITSNLTQRFSDHAFSKSWWDEVSSINLSIHESRESALLEEAKAIANEYPEHNQILGHHTQDLTDLSVSKTRKSNSPLPEEEINYLRSLDGEDVYIRAAELKRAGWSVVEIRKAVRVVPDLGSFRVQLRYRLNASSNVPVPTPPLNREQKRLINYTPRSYLTAAEEGRLREYASYSRRLRPQYTEEHPIAIKVQEFREFIVELRLRGVDQNDIAKAAGLDRSRIQKRYQEGLKNSAK
jgi:predicted GIY-YIG superfamily endonuclease